LKIVQLQAPAARGHKPLGGRLALFLFKTDFLKG